MIRKIFVSLFFLSAVLVEAQHLQSIEEVCHKFPERMDSIFLKLNLEYPGLQEVKSKYAEGNMIGACSELLKHYKLSRIGELLAKEQPNVSNEKMSVADSVLQDIYTFQEVSAKVPRLEDGGLNWYYNGPEDDIEWAWALNRHYPIQTLLSAWYETGNQTYVQYMDRFIQDWIRHSWPYPGVKSSTAMWRGLEVSFREKVWARVFYELIDNEGISDATRLLILSSLPDHAHYARNFHAQNNWLTMEISGLATVAAYFPEYSKSKEWLNYTINTMVESMRDQVYPDGVQTELTSSYHYVALNNFSQYQEICSRAEIKLPDFYAETMEKMWAYLVFSMRPDGYGILNNDADRMNNRERIMGYLETHPNSEWEYVIANGDLGQKPTTASFFYPWAGHLISRSGFDKNAHWSFFDIGPWGSGHQHNDKLHLSIAAFGQDYLVDAGRFAYRGEVADKFRGYACGSQGHNVILFNDKGQDPGPKLAETPLGEDHFLLTANYDYAWGEMSDFMHEKAAHEHVRSMLYVHNKFWVVVDKVHSQHPSEKQILWHWHPKCEVKVIGREVTGLRNNGILRIIPADQNNYQIEVVRGQEGPEIQGWYSPVYNVYEPNVATIFHSPESKDAVFVWLLVPSEGSQKQITARIVGQTEDLVELEILGGDLGNYHLKVPYQNSQMVTFESH